MTVPASPVAWFCYRLCSPLRIVWEGARSGQMYSLEAILVTTAVLLMLAILASKAAARLGVPALLLFL